MYDVFISYNWEIKQQVRQLYQVLSSLNYKVWLDERELNAGSSPLTAELAVAIRDSKVIISCIIMDYCRLWENLYCSTIGLLDYWVLDVL